MSNEEIKKEYSRDKSIYISLEQISNGLLSTLITNNDLDIHSITSRVKTEKSLKGKISRQDKNYKSLSDLTDIVGIRITTYFQDDVDKISAIIENEFVVDDENSIDKRKAIEPDRFGYMSLHLVVQHSKARINLPEYSKFDGIKFEIQIRTILQHAWAEIEHDIGYKSSSQVPQYLRRKFSRLSGLLELADEEFLAIRNEISQYRIGLKESIKTASSLVTLDSDSIESFIISDPYIHELENQFSSIFKCTLEEPRQNGFLDILTYFSIFDIKTIQDLKGAYAEVEPYILPFLTEWLSSDDRSGSYAVDRGISLLYVCYVILALRDDDALFNSFISISNFHNKEMIPDLIKSTFRKIENEKVNHNFKSVSAI